jgi:hypothetical protein
MTTACRLVLPCHDAIDLHQGVARGCIGTVVSDTLTGEAVAACVGLSRRRVRASASRVRSREETALCGAFCGVPLARAAPVTQRGVLTQRRRSEGVVAIVAA